MKNITLVLFILLNIKISAQVPKDCSSCATHLMKPQQIKNLSMDEIRYLMNDLFARKGYVFNNREIDLYFSNKAWYKAVNNNDKIVYNTIEKQNIKLFQDRTTALKAEREKLLSALKNLKSLVLAKNKSQLSSRYSLSIEKDPFDCFSKVVSALDLADINWLKNKGMYMAKIDNGLVVMEYELRIDENQVNFKYGNQGGSEIGETLYPSDYNTEFTYWWYFEWKNNKLKFIKLHAAG